MTTLGLKQAALKRWAVVAMVGASLLGGLAIESLAAPKPGVVTTKRGEEYHGDVDETAIPGSVASGTWRRPS